MWSYSRDNLQVKVKNSSSVSYISYKCSAIWSICCWEKSTNLLSLTISFVTTILLIQIQMPVLFMLFNWTKCKHWQLLNLRSTNYLHLYFQLIVIQLNFPLCACDSKGFPLNILSHTVHIMKLQLNKWKAVSVLMVQCCMTLVWMSV